MLFSSAVKLRAIVAMGAKVDLAQERLSLRLQDLRLPPLLSALDCLK